MYLPCYVPQPNSFPSMAEELQFYYQVMRKFQSIFQTQETDITFYTYDKMPEVPTSTCT